jgi:hypothetical protein
VIHHQAKFADTDEAIQRKINQAGDAHPILRRSTRWVSAASWARWHDAAGDYPML